MSASVSTLNRDLTDATRRRYERIAPIYDLFETFAEHRYRPWRQRLWSMVTGKKILEVGVGTGKNFPYYPSRAQVTAVDLTPGMLARATLKARRMNLAVALHMGDVQNLEFADNTFDTIVATCVFCSVPDPVLGLREVQRVLKPGGKVFLMDHVRSENPFLARIMDFINPVVVRMMGPNINRQTVSNVNQSGLIVEQVEDLGMGGLFKLIVAQKSR